MVLCGNSGIALLLIVAQLITRQLRFELPDNRPLNCMTIATKGPTRGRQAHCGELKEVVEVKVRL
jgi:hypothetical protein